MKKKFACLLVAIVGLLASCQDTKQIANLQDQARRLEAQIQKEREENIELSSYRFSMESQYKKKNQDYVKCIEDGKYNLESLNKKYEELGSDYNKLQVTYKSLTKASEAHKEMATRVIVELEERIKKIGKIKSGVAKKSRYSYRRVKRKNRRR